MMLQRTISSIDNQQPEHNIDITHPLISSKFPLSWLPLYVSVVSDATVDLYTNSVLATIINYKMQIANFVLTKNDKKKCSFYLIYLQPYCSVAALKLC